MNSNKQSRTNRGAMVAVSMARLGRQQEALELSNQLVEDNPYDMDAVAWGEPMYRRAMVRGLTGDADGALADLQLVLNTPTAGYTAWDLHYDPDWDFLRNDPRFVELATPNNLIQ